MTKQRIDRLNSLLKEVISEVVRKEVDNPEIDEFVSITRVDISKDLRHAKVYVSVIGDDDAKTRTLKALATASSFISVHASKKVAIRYFPSLSFILDDTVDKVMRIEELIQQIHQEEDSRPHRQPTDESGS